jgi:cytochrome c
MSRFGTPLAALVAATFVLACSSDDSDDGGSGNGGGGSGGSGMQMPPAVSFAEDIHPILQMKCSGTGNSCHGVDQAPYQPAHGSSDVDEAYEATQGDGVTGEPVYERILERITSEDPTSIMPPSYASPPCQGAIGAPGCVTAAELALIEAWIEQGAPP